jgi:long-chain acyl-CoA synthetase
MNPLLDYSSIKSLPQIWEVATEKFGEVIALKDPHSKPQMVLTYAQLNQQIRQFAAGLQGCGLNPQDKVSLIADNSPRWLIADQGIMTAGGVDAVRSSQAEREELLYIVEDSNSTFVVVENLETLKKLRPELDKLPITLVILLSDEDYDGDSTLKILSFSQLMAVGENRELNRVEVSPSDLATLIYTSGTTGKPKGAMLSHGNLLHQVNSLDAIIQPSPGDHILSILPSWHSYERSAEYFLFSRGCTLVYTSIRTFKKDLKQFQPQYMVAVPRLWESIYEGIQKQLREQPLKKQNLVKFFWGISEQHIRAKRIAENKSLEHFHVSPLTRFQAQFKASFLAPLHSLADKIVYGKIRQGLGGKIKSLISGGGSLATHLEDFYEIIGIPLLVGYGLTETSPVTNARTVEHNIRGSSGRPLMATEIKIVHPETRAPLPREERGLVLIRGPQVMQGYYKKPEATAKAIDAEGWFDSGDLGLITPTGDLVITGREKDTIVLSNGENIEPQPIEDACVQSPYIDQIMLAGQDQKSVGALIVPNLEVLHQWAEENQLSLNFPPAHASPEEIENSDLNNKAVQQLFRQELNQRVQNRPGYRIDDRIGPYRLILEPFSMENGLMTQTLKIKRSVVMERYKELIEGMFS